MWGAAELLLVCFFLIGGKGGWVRAGRGRGGPASQRGMVGLELPVRLLGRAWGGASCHFLFELGGLVGGGRSLCFLSLLDLQVGFCFLHGLHEAFCTIAAHEC